MNAMGESSAIEIEYDLPQAPAKVWRVLTESRLLARWLMENDIRAEVGHRFTFRATPMPGWDGVIHCEVREVVPETRLVYTWRGGSDTEGRYGSALDTTVTWTLEPTTSGGTRLRLEHAGFRPKDAFAYENMSKGWSGHIAKRLADVVDAEG